MTSQELFDAGYAMPLYSITHDRSYWRYRNEEITLPGGAVEVHSLPGVPFMVAKIEDVRACAAKTTGSSQNVSKSPEMPETPGVYALGVVS